MRLVLVASTAAVLGLLLVPATTLALLPERSAAVGQFKDWLDALAPGVDLDHVVAFALLGFVARFAQTRPRVGRTVLLLSLLGLACEGIQFFVPGRELWLSDAALNVAGAVIGYGAAAGLALAAGMVRGGPAHPTGRGARQS